MSVRGVMGNPRPGRGCGARSGGRGAGTEGCGKVVNWPLKYL
ncbi:hypothetical protein DESPIGER_1863 [Desulfovibrio piger]|uniref:Uncharacterized protein n=1 Tax=Desulfovibrio piger TaxID=901 RepID=A0A1K1LG46_9BACT|nr:hypothetical protein DESPIGER_1863 [Desulfovibrio piger]